jgi:hypothetical protein
MPAAIVIGAADAETGAPQRERSSPYPRWLTGAAVYVPLLVLCALTAYWAMFSRFAPYDDEGFFDYTLKLFITGHALYSSVFSDYGPFYYELFGGLFTVVGHGVTTDAGRYIQLAIWLGASLGLGLAAHRLTGRLTLGVAALATSFTLMQVLTNEPMHAEALIGALLTATAIVIAFGLPRWPRASLFAIGAVAGALLLTKINVGGYAVISIAFAAVMAGGSLVRYTALRRVMIVAFVLVGPAVMIKSLNTPWARLYAALAALSALSLVFVAAPRKIDETASDESACWPRWLIGGCAACLLPVLAVVFAQGTSPGAMIDQIILVPSRQATALTTPITLGGQVLWWSLAAAAVAWTLRQIGSTSAGTATSSPSLWGGLLRAFAGVAILLSLGGEFPFALAPVAPFALAMPLAWVAALPSRRDPPGPRWRLARLLIPSLAILQALLAYPVAGSQLYLGGILLVLCGVICLADAWSELVAWNRERPALGPVAASGLSALFIALAVGTTFEYVVQPLQTYHDAFRANTSLDVAGATRLRLPAPETAEFDQIVGALRGHCRTLISLPGLYSFNIWSGLPTPSPLTGQPFWHLLSSAQQQTVLAAAKASPGLCELRNDVEAATYGEGAPPPRVPLVAYLEDAFKPILQVGSYLVETRRS